ncbi:hypothetical protein DFH07DRAFT_986186 [Mycena maculata]|uniref:ribonuclease H n=1 Tax=Mycena maculata TaxID=230809 RepID=A0AAD7MWS6_9AGAR|nr:hypothetical protein DFH07DRAFT_986186 [Mycena maculata]
MLESLPRKWNPLRPQPEDYEDDDFEANKADAAANTDDRTITFDTRITQPTLNDTIRIFVENGATGTMNPPNTQMEPESDEEPNVVYTDGSALENGSEKARAGAGIFYGTDDVRNMSIKVPKHLAPSNQVAEVLAAKEAAEYAPLDIPLTIYTDSKYTLEGLTKNLTKLEDEGYTAPNSELLRTAAARMRQRKARTSFKWVKGHSGIAGNEGADRLADRGARKRREDDIDMRIPNNLVVHGAKFSMMTQSLAYKIIRQRRMKRPAYQAALKRRATVRNLALAKNAAADPDGNLPPQSKIWASVRHKDFPRNIRYFLWMLIHDGYKALACGYPPLLTKRLLGSFDPEGSPSTRAEFGYTPKGKAFTKCPFFAWIYPGVGIDGAHPYHCPRSTPPSHTFTPSVNATRMPSYPRRERSVKARPPIKEHLIIAFLRDEYTIDVEFQQLIKKGKKMQQELPGNTLLELYLTLPEPTEDNNGAGPLRRKALRLLQNTTLPYDPTQALILCSSRLYPEQLRYFTSTPALLVRHETDILARNDVVNGGCLKDGFQPGYKLHRAKFKVTSLTRSTHTRSVPRVFMYYHNFHQPREIQENETECPNLVREHGVIREIRQNNERLADQHDLSVSEVGAGWIGGRRHLQIPFTFTGTAWSFLRKSQGFHTSIANLQPTYSSKAHSYS